MRVLALGTSWPAPRCSDPRRRPIARNSRLRPTIPSYHSPSPSSFLIRVSTVAFSEHFFANPHSALRQGTDRAPRPVAIRVAEFPDPIDPVDPHPSACRHPAKLLIAKIRVVDDLRHRPHFAARENACKHISRAVGGERSTLPGEIGRASCRERV